MGYPLEAQAYVEITIINLRKNKGKLSGPRDGG